MKIRELLQTEIWSKETTRKIVVGFGIAVVSACGLWFIEFQWLTPGERMAGRDALVQIDALEDFGSISNEDFKARERQAEAKVEAARRAALTIRDERVADALDAYAVSIDIQQGSARMREIERQRYVAIEDSQRELGKKIDSQGIQVTQFLRATLHRVLD